MAQFTIYRSGDASAPVLTGAAGTLLSVLDAILVTGYGAQSAAGWTKPIANSGNCGHYLQGAGAGFYLFINDNGPNVTSTFKEAWATGWETMATIAAPVGTGTGQFPTPAQLLATGHTVVRKSTAVSGTARDWICFADSRTFYLFILTGDTSGVYYSLWFGDGYSIKTSADSYDCFLCAGSAENTAAAGNHPWDLQSLQTTAIAGCFIARTYASTGTSLTLGKHGDYAKAGSTGLLGLVPFPNGPDIATYLSPIWHVEAVAGQVRGRMRGLYHAPHALASFVDGQTFSGTGSFAGKDFYILSKGPNNGYLVIETSNTLETN